MRNRAAPLLRSTVPPACDTFATGTTMSSPTKPGFTPGKPTVYTPKKKPAPAAGATTTQPDRERDRSIGTRLDAPPETDLASDPNNRGLPMDLTTGKSVSEEDTKE